MALGISAVLIRKGVAELAPPLVGAALSLLSGTLVLATIGLRNSHSNLRQNKRAVGLLLLAGVSAALGIAANFFALSIAPVVMVAPIANTHPLFALLLSHLFLQRLERITLRVVLATLLVVGGVILITIGSVN